MWFPKFCQCILLLFLTLIPVISYGFQLGTVDFSVNYFRERQVKYVCVLSCGNKTWDMKFAKAAISRSISVSSTAVDIMSDKTMKRCFKHDFKYIGVLLDATCEDIEQIFYSASINRWLDFKHIWLIIDETNIVFAYKTNNNSSAYENSSKILQILNNMNISVDADIVMASKYGQQFKLTDIFNFGKVQGGNLITTGIGTWTPENHQMIRALNRCKYYRRYNFQQIGMRIISVATTEKFDPRMLLEVRPVPGVVTITRTSTIILNELAQIHNFRFVYTRTDKWLGSYEPNSSRAVATGLYFQEQDISSVFRYLDILFGRVTLIHPSLTNLETRYYYRIPTTGPGKYENQFLRPLSVGTWFSLLAVSAMCTVIMVLASRWESRPSWFQYGLFSVAAIVCQQYFEDDAYDMSVRRISTARKVTTFVIGMSGVLVYNFYTSSVVSWLLNGPPPSITSLWELEASPLELIFEDVGYTQSWLTVPNYYFNTRNAEIEDIIRHRIRTRKRKVPLFMPAEEGIAMVKAGGYAYLTEPYSANPLISATFDKAELCELGSLSSMEKVNLYPGVQINSPYKEFFTWSLTRLLERGIISCIQRRTSPVRVACEGSSPQALALGGAAPAFILLAWGYLLAVGILIGERFVHKMKKRRQSLS